MSNKKYRTADETIAEINSRVETIKRITPPEVYETRAEIIEQHRTEAIALVEEDRDSKYPTFDQIISQFGYGCSLRSLYKKSKKLGKLSPELDKLFNDSVTL